MFQLEVFFTFLDYLHIWGLVKTRWTVEQLAQIVVATTFRAQTGPTVWCWQRVDHADWVFSLRRAVLTFNKREEEIIAGGIRTLVEELNTAKVFELERLLYRYTGWWDPMFLEPGFSKTIPSGPTLPGPAHRLRTRLGNLIRGRN